MITRMHHNVAHTLPTLHGTRKSMTLLTEAPLLHQSDSVQILPSYFFKVDFNIVLSYVLAMWSLSFRFPHQNPVCTSVMLLEPVKSAALTRPKPE